MSKYSTIAELQNVTKSFGEVVAVSDASFTIEKGKIVGFLGPNGSGKTTSIRMLLGLLRPQSGYVNLFGVNPFTHNGVKYLIGYIPEENAFPKWLTAQKYLESLGRFYMPKEESRVRATEVLEQVGLDHVANKRILQFSKGMRQRIKIAQALLHRPALVIGDEPFNGLDPLVRRDMFELIKSYQKDYHMTFLISSHILFEVDRLANNIVLLYKGRTIAQGTPHRIREMIQDQPHEIQISSPVARQISSKLVELTSDSIISSVAFTQSGVGESVVTVDTLDPRAFYHLLTDVIVDNDFRIHEIRAVGEGLENLFKSLTVG